MLTHTHMDNEKHASEAGPSPDSGSVTPPSNFFKRWNSRIENLAGFEARGLARVPPNERQTPSSTGLLQMLLLWFSANMSVNNLAVALTGPLVFQLGFLDSSMCAVFGVLLGSMSTAYMSTWGPVSAKCTCFPHKLLI